MGDVGLARGPKGGQHLQCQIDRMSIPLQLVNDFMLRAISPSLRARCRSASAKCPRMSRRSMIGPDTEGKLITRRSASTEYSSVWISGE